MLKMEEALLTLHRMGWTLRCGMYHIQVQRRHRYPSYDNVCDQLKSLHGYTSNEIMPYNDTIVIRVDTSEFDDLNFKPISGPDEYKELDAEASMQQCNACGSQLAATTIRGPRGNHLWCPKCRVFR